MNTESRAEEKCDASQSDEAPLIGLLNWAAKQRSSCLALGYKPGDEISQTFFDNLPLSKAGDEQYVRLHLGRCSKRRRREAPYGSDRSGRLTFRGKLVSDGGFRDGRIVDAVQEELEFGPGCEEEEVPVGKSSDLSSNRKSRGVIPHEH